ncbi:hypothetical protein [Flavivirga jejuensis]|uniref:Uncharacterized protein n=1 Tax=Flavivirga jejuensis TaxID=870487 RepID=A0ABT8WSN0_9FLAO|nr:hypothetical protein [Flavivirga jejuensis]MDO5976202.1 hypothetical protein [Flavivirga jejuensis]
MKITAIFLFLFLLFKPLIPLVEYAVFYDYIKNELCENKEAPELQCNGKCYLKKELAKATDTEKSSDKGASILFECSIVYFQYINNYHLLFFSTEQLSKIDTSYNKIYKFYYMDFVFQPPIA